MTRTPPRRPAPVRKTDAERTETITRACRAATFDAPDRFPAILEWSLRLAGLPVPDRAADAA